MMFYVVPKNAPDAFVCEDCSERYAESELDGPFEEREGFTCSVCGKDFIKDYSDDSLAQG